MNNILNSKQRFIFALCAIIAIFNCSFGINSYEIEEIIKKERQHNQEKKIRHYEDELKKLNKEKKEIEKQEASWINVIYKGAYYIANWNLCPLVGMIAVALFLPVRDKSLNNKDHDEAVKGVIARGALITWGGDLMIKTLAKIPEERLRCKESIERKIENISSKLNKPI